MLYITSGKPSDFWKNAMSSQISINKSGFQVSDHSAFFEFLFSLGFICNNQIGKTFLRIHHS